ncbi:hypothetical protein [Pelagicoccus albus]|uniref:PEP-CTERM protein-sorting domain-containing protein n=1 Tax=Pelagicoccus albus TaxID=415222 RepID=A0A7X1B974_9BACT|nr:hypothetical protein [Pelagicoccus albus]MBC2606703.1 hypothetical protein [Pelagicoccus albus]
MKRLPLAVVSAFIAFASLLAPLAESIENGSFEDRINGWNVFLWANGGSSSTLINWDTGETDYPFSYNTISLFTDSSEGFVSTPASTLGSSGNMLQLYSTQASDFWIDFLDPLGSQWGLGIAYYGFGLYQDIALEKGERVSGWARFETNDYPPFDADQATVSIDGSLLWEQSVLDVENSYYINGYFIPLGGVGDWQNWSFVAPADGIYRIALGLYGDDQESSTAYFDEIKVSVPDSSSTLGFVSALLLLAVARYKVRKQ